MFMAMKWEGAVHEIPLGLVFDHPSLVRILPSLVRSPGDFFIFPQHSDELKDADSVGKCRLKIHLIGR
jgi:hypothetical protein